MTRPLFVLVMTYFIDQAHKYWLFFVYDIEQKQPVAFTQFMDIVLVWNKGISYGMFQQDSPWGGYILAAFKVIVAIALIVWMFRSPHKLEQYGLALIAAGALANATDRIHYGAVMDMFAFKIEALNFHWYVFNLADVAISVGVAALLYYNWKFAPKTP